jgi:translocation and assembly module TamB
MTLGLDVVFRDSVVDGWPVNRFDGSGSIAVGVPGDIVFRDYVVDVADFDLRTVRRILEAVDLKGRIAGSGVLNGPWLEVEYAGELRHEDAPLPPTHARGVVRIDALRDTLGVWSDLLFDSLSLDGLHTSYPQLREVTGAFSGRIVLEGYLDSAQLEANLEGPAGAVFAEGVTRLLPYSKGFSELDLRVSRLDLERINPGLPRTQLFGRLRGGGLLDSLAGSWAQANAVIRASSMEGVRVDSVSVAMVVADSAIRLDTLEVWGRHLRMTGGGQIGIAEGLPGTITLSAANDSMAAIEPLLEDLFGPLGAEYQEIGQPWGSIELAVDVDGTLEKYVASGTVDVRQLDRGGLHTSRLHAEAQWNNSSNQLRLTGSIDSLELGRWEFADLELNVAGPADSLRWFARSRFGADGLGAWIARGQIIKDDSRRSIPIELMGFLLASGAWFVDTTSVVQLGDSGLDLSRVVIASDIGAGRIEVDGRLPFSGAGSLTASIQALPLDDVWILQQLNYRNVSGDLGATFALSGTRDDPVMELSVGLVNGRVGRFQAPQMLGTLGYEDGRVVGDVRLLRTGEEILNIAVRLPLDLSLREVARRALPDPISVQAVADGVDLSFLDAVTPIVRESGGTLDADFGLTGTWDEPQLTGRLAIENGSATYPGIGVRHENVNGSFRLSSDTIAIERLAINSGPGSAEVSGYVRLEELSRPVLNLRVSANEFRGVDLRDFLTVTATGILELTGPVFKARATGEGTVTSGVLHFADLINKELINIEDTLYSAFVDPLLIRQEGLGVAFQNRFLDSLRVDSLRLQMGPDVWMRSSEANIQLMGDVTVNKVRRQYSLNGELQTPRGVYRVTPGPSLVQLVATREFTVARGEVRYLGTPDLNAAIDIEARHRLRSVRGEEVTVMVHIGGTVYEPRLTFSSDINPPIPEAEILSYLFFGAPSVAEFRGTGNLADQRLAEQGLNQFLGAVSGQLEYSLISDLQVPLDYLQISPTGLGTGVYGVDFAVGKRLGEKWFVTVNPRFCRHGELYEIEALRVGASLEYRLGREWLVLLSRDPVQSCSAYSPQQLPEKYQLGVDVFWEKRY